MKRVTRRLTPTEAAHIGDVLRRLREHFYAWSAPETVGHEYHLADFAYYEGCDRRDDCCRAILGEAAPFALGQELVRSHGFQWVMLPPRATPVPSAPSSFPSSSPSPWRYAVTHPTLPEPIDLLSLEDGSWNDREYDPGSEPKPGDGSMTHDSLETILRRIGQIPED